MAKQISTIPIVRFQNGALSPVSDDIVVEETLDIRINGRSRFLCMRLPGSDAELAVGLCFSAGVIQSFSNISRIQVPEEQSGIVEIFLHGDVPVADEPVNVITSSSGSLGSRSQQDLLARGEAFIEERLVIPPPMVLSLQRDFLGRQNIFEKTGGTHAAALYDGRGGCLAFAEDVGRHNAFDKCIGRVLMEDRRSEARIATLSSRLSCEMVAKAVRFGVEIVTGVSAPTSRAVDHAASHNLTLVGFVRDSRFNIYSAPGRIRMG